MSTITPQAQSRDSVLPTRYNAALSRVFAGLKAIEQRISNYCEDAVLRSLDRRLLEDTGFEAFLQVEYRPDHAFRNEFALLREVFSWTRFGN